MYLGKKYYINVIIKRTLIFIKVILSREGEWFSSFSFVVWFTILRQTAAGLLGCCHFKTECTDQTCWIYCLHSLSLACADFGRSASFLKELKMTNWVLFRIFMRLNSAWIFKLARLNHMHIINYTYSFIWVYNLWSTCLLIK